MVYIVKGSKQIHIFQLFTGTKGVFFVINLSTTFSEANKLATTRQIPDIKVTFQL